MTEHISNRCEWFSSYKKFDTIENIKIGDGKYIQAIGSGAFLHGELDEVICSNRKDTKIDCEELIEFAS